MVDDEILVFLVSAETIDVVRLPNTLRRVAKLMRQFNLNLKAVSVADPARVVKQIPAAQRLLGQLYQLLIVPLSEQLSDFRKLIVVPHRAALHYLPFHALFDGERYLCEHVEVSYLPSASLLHYQAGRESRSQAPPSAGTLCCHRVIAIGGALPYAVEEATRMLPTKSVVTLPSLNMTGDT